MCKFAMFVSRGGVLLTHLRVRRYRDDVRLRGDEPPPDDDAHWTNASGTLPLAIPPNRSLKNTGWFGPDIGRLPMPGNPDIGPRHGLIQVVCQILVGSFCTGFTRRAPPAPTIAGGARYFPSL